MLCLWRSVIEPGSSPASLSNSYDEPTQIKSPDSDFQIGIGVPQYLFLDTPQSLAAPNQLANLDSPTDFGTQLIFSFNPVNLSLISSTLTNHELTAR